MIGGHKKLTLLYDASLLAVVFIPFLLLMISGTAGIGLTAIFGIGFFSSIFLGSRLHFIPQSVWGAFILIVISIAGIRYFATEDALLDIGIELVVVLMAIRLVSRLTPREDLQLYALSFLLLASATLVDDGLTFGILFFVYVVVGTVSLTLFHFHSEISVRAKRDEIDTSLNAQFFGVLAIIAGFILVVSVVIFFAFPRVGLGFFAQQSRAGAQVAGFSTSVELGDHGAIRDNPQVVMRIEMENPQPWLLKTAHWRTISFDRYDGKTWHRPKKPSFRPLRRNHKNLHPNSGVADMELSVYLEPLGENLLPVMWPTDRVELGVKDTPIRWGPGSGHLAVDDLGDVRHTISNEMGVQYRLHLAKTPTIDSVAFPIERIPNEFRPRYLQMPKMSERFRIFARSLVDNEKNLQENVQSIVLHMQTRYDYTLDLPPVGDNPVESFLFDTKTGHCEYFATSTVMILRENGIPARLVNGFLGGEWNAIGNFVAVRHGDAHSWVEYYEPYVGWVPIDPTPSSGVEAGSPTTTQLQAIYDAAKLTWTKWIIEYDLASQIRFATDLFSTFKPRALMNEETDEQETKTRIDYRATIFWLGLFAFFAFSFSSGRRRGRRSIVGLILLTAGSVGWMAWFQGETAAVLGALPTLAGFAIGFALRPKSDLDELETLFRSIEKILTKRGLERRTDEGPDAFLTRAIAFFPDIRDLVRFRDLYLRARFGQFEIDRIDLRTLCSKLTKAISRHGNVVSADQNQKMNNHS